MAHNTLPIPEIELRTIEENKITFILTNTDVSIANCLRKAIVSEVPTIAIDLVEIEDNTSMLADEFIAHRLGLLPLISHRALDPDGPTPYRDKGGHPRTFLWHHEADEEAQCEIKFELDVRNTDEHPLEVTTQHLILSREHGGELQEDCGVMPVEYDPDYPVVIAKLKRNQALKFTAIAKKGLGKMHSKWSPASGVVFTYEPVVQLNYEKLEGLTVEERKMWVESCPPGLLQFNDITGQVEVLELKDINIGIAFSAECEKCAKDLFGLEHGDMISVTPKCGPNGRPNRFHFTVETNGALDPVTLVRAALWELWKKLDVLYLHLNPDERRFI
ncbi:DNA-directed RNA polymerase [Baffinella frigidus]|nr:DNA-directed RNA polymerase [Cryptophyta sp. CCMP2293]|mmetsp:Transcript_48794/g.116146  ORF Transcript_48794/g.116146 Transcript_48794/m.116146 type:complete len:331 (-) Transcript_48794:143-1135(-)|eukprot:CAMPEP_0180132094 /NCGR_PEP_ID=MMETSP0986-20121125/8788_1 /TAXON_ID=697907 /ORGANISM="non described non described, Strain CCMP2293" /LENGTH=330 /DNA_ID=CAMNT_0022072051 /DNA_START=156 /DNA_END=1148 /DNA_ORIENTATION=-